MLYLREIKSANKFTIYAIKTVRCVIMAGVLAYLVKAGLMLFSNILLLRK